MAKAFPLDADLAVNFFRLLKFLRLEQLSGSKNHFLPFSPKEFGLLLEEGKDILLLF